jgi:hypothetical protein
MAGRNAQPHPTSSRLAAAAIIVLWIVIIFLGRAIAYDAEVWGSWSLGVHS